MQLPLWTVNQGKSTTGAGRTGPAAIDREQLERMFRLFRPQGAGMAGRNTSLCLLSG